MAGRRPPRLEGRGALCLKRRSCEWPGHSSSPRWHEGRLWFCDWIDRQVMAVDMDGKAEVMLTRDSASHSMGYSIEWLPDGRPLMTGDKSGASSLTGR